MCVEWRPGKELRVLLWPYDVERLAMLHIQVRILERQLINKSENQSLGLKLKYKFRVISMSTLFEGLHLSCVTLANRPGKLSFQYQETSLRLMQKGPRIQELGKGSRFQRTMFDKSSKVAESP